MVVFLDWACENMPTKIIEESWTLPRTSQCYKNLWKTERLSLLL